MPELPEVEHYRRILQPLIVVASSSEPPSVHSRLQVTIPRTVPTPKVFPSDSEWQTIVQSCHVQGVQRKGKLLRLILRPHAESAADALDGKKLEPVVFLYMHMGMTGRISTPAQPIPTLTSLTSDSSYPPAHTHVILTATHNQYQVAFSDPRRFGAVSLMNHLSQQTVCPLHQQWIHFAPDILEGHVPPPDTHMDIPLLQSSPTDPYLQLIGKTKAVKALLLDQRQVVSGIGNWIADEVLYQSQIHPDQTFLNQDQVHRIQHNLEHIVTAAIQCNIHGQEYPSHWIFHQRWSCKNTNVLDCKGRRITFISSAGRTSAIVPSIQKKRMQKGIHTRRTRRITNNKES